uniref:CCHC-type domain-containing protein n=1 Tax=viral metagenome TaxID=1070528 RepID=A0A6C0BCJ5_9ZZZZ
MSTNIYILRLQQGRFYIGRSANPMKRYQEHLEGRGSAWTRKFRPLGIEKVFENASPFDEDKFTKEYMAKYGLDRVRGGVYVAMELDVAQRDSLTRELWGAKDHCIRCGYPGHFFQACKAKVASNGRRLVWDCEACTSMFENEAEWKSHEMKCWRYKMRIAVCYRCGRRGHFSVDCFARRDLSGNILIIK